MGDQTPGGPEKNFLPSIHPPSGNAWLYIILLLFGSSAPNLYGTISDKDQLADIKSELKLLQADIKQIRNKLSEIQRTGDSNQFRIKWLEKKASMSRDDYP